METSLLNLLRVRFAFCNGGRAAVAGPGHRGRGPVERWSVAPRARSGPDQGPARPARLPHCCQGRLVAKMVVPTGNFSAAGRCCGWCRLRQPGAWPRARPGSQLGRVVGTQPLAAAVDGRRPRHKLQTPKKKNQQHSQQNGKHDRQQQTVLGNAVFLAPCRIVYGTLTIQHTCRRWYPASWQRFDPSVRSTALTRATGETPSGTSEFRHVWFEHVWSSVVQQKLHPKYPACCAIPPGSSKCGLQRPPHASCIGECSQTIWSWRGPRNRAATLLALVEHCGSQARLPSIRE